MISTNQAPPPSGLATLARALAEWDELDDTVAEIYAARSESTDRPAPDLPLSGLPKNDSSPKEKIVP